MLVLISILLGAGLLIIVGVLLELRSHATVDSQDRGDAEPQMDFTQDETLSSDDNPLYGFFNRWRESVQQHPVKTFGIVETAFWLILFIPFFDHAFDPENSLTAYIIWWFTILPHEIGHLICAPFGTFLMFLGGSVWQVLIFVLMASWLFVVRRYLTASLFFLMIAGHSFINMSVYIRDARTRELDLLFGLDSSHHDWWNILRRLGLLNYDQTIADLAVITGSLIILATIGLGIWSAWVLPRQRIGPHPRYKNLQNFTPPAQ